MKNFKIKTILFVLLLLPLTSCFTCLDEKEMGVLLDADPYKNLTLSRFDGLYSVEKFTFWGKKIVWKCKILIKEGKIRTQKFGTIHLQNLSTLMVLEGETIYEFQDEGIDYQLYERPGGELDLVSINLWLTLKKLKEEKKNEK